MNLRLISVIRIEYKKSAHKCIKIVQTQLKEKMIVISDLLIYFPINDTIKKVILNYFERDVIH